MLRAAPSGDFYDLVPQACERVSAEIGRASEGEVDAYLVGAMHDGTFSRLHRTKRIASKEVNWLLMIQSALERFGRSGWIYQEGSTRSVHVIEFSRALPETPAWNLREKAAYARGYFDAEGGIPHDLTARFYIQLVQKNRDDLAELRAFLHELGIECGTIHNPSRRVDPDYWRFYVRSRFHKRFATAIGSWHPAKRARLLARFTNTPGLSLTH